jgi:hypothetical protein
MGSRVHTLYIGYEPVNPKPSLQRVNLNLTLNPTVNLK